MAGASFICPMHPEVRQPEPGSCPRCGMALVESEAHAMREPMSMMAREHYTPYRWVQAVIASLALWLITSPFTLGFTSDAMMWSDVASGIAVLVLALVALGRERGWASWAIAGVGLWLLAAPLVFWAPDAGSYANDTLVGAMLIAFAFLIPMGMQMPGADVPPGWSYNPSAWPQRAPIIALSLVSFFAARYMAAYQLGHTTSVWEPFFGDGTRRVLESDVSRAWPVSDAGLGAMTYLIEVLMGFMGDKRRWRTMPWMVAAFGVVVIPLGIASITLVILQPLAVGAWCTLCLFTAAAMLAMIPLALDEIVAMVQFVRRRKREGQSAWHVFWYGDNLEHSEHVAPRREESWRPRGMLWGVTTNWPLAISAALGVWLMFAPDVLGSRGAMANSDHLFGALVIVVAVIAMAEVARPARFLNIPLGAWLLAAPWLLDGGSTLARANSAIMGALVIILSLPLGKIRDHYGTYDRAAAWGRHLVPALGRRSRSR